MMRTCVILGAAPYDTFPTLPDEFLQDAYVIAADGGYKTAMRQGIRVDRYIGDMDSLGSESLPQNLSCEVLPTEKDYTDVHTAVVESLRRGFRDFLFLGCTGGRMDHTLANVTLLELLDRHGANGTILDKQNKIMLLSNGKMELTREKKYQYVSIIPLDECIYGVTLTGMKYPLKDAELHRQQPIAVSNEPISEFVTISIRSGYALIILSGDEVND